MTTATLTIEVDGKKAKKTVVELEKSLKNLEVQGNKSQKNITKTDGALKKFGKTVNPVTVSVTALSAAFVASVAAAIQFQTKMAEISTLLGQDEQALADVTQGVLDLNAAYGGGTQQQASAMYSIISAGAADAAEAVSILDASNKLAIGGVTDVATASDGLTSALNAYGASASEAEDYADAMFVAMKAGKTTIGELSANLGQVAPIASAVGVSFDELLAATSAVTTAGVSTSEAFTQIRAAIVAVQKPSKEAVKVANQLGLEWNTTALKAKGFTGFMQDVKKAVGDNTDLMSKLFPRVEALGAAMALTGGQAEQLADNMDGMREKAGATNEAFEEMKKTVAFEWGRLTAHFENMAIAVGEKLLPHLENFLHNLNYIADVLSDNVAPSMDEVREQFNEQNKLYLEARTKLDELVKSLEDGAIQTWEFHLRSKTLATTIAEAGKAQNELNIQLIAMSKGMTVAQYQAKQLDAGLKELLKDESLFADGIKETTAGLKGQEKATKKKVTANDKLADSLLDAAIAEQDLLDKNYANVDALEKEIEALKGVSTETGLLGEQQKFWNSIKDKNIALTREQSDALVKEKYDLEQYAAAVKTETENMERLWENMTDNMQKAFGDLIYDNIHSMLKDGELTFKAFTDTVLDMFIRMLADMAAKAATAKILEWLGLGGGGWTQAASGIANYASSVNTASSAVSNFGSVAGGAASAYQAYAGSLAQGANASQSFTAALESLKAGTDVTVYATGEFAVAAEGVALATESVGYSAGATASEIAALNAEMAAGEAAFEGLGLAAESSGSSVGISSGAVAGFAAAAVAAYIVVQGAMKSARIEAENSAFTDHFNQLRTETEAFKGEMVELGETYRIVGEHEGALYVHQAGTWEERTQEVMIYREALNEVGVSIRQIHTDSSDAVTMITGNQEQLAKAAEILKAGFDNAKVSFSSFKQSVTGGMTTLTGKVSGNAKDWEEFLTGAFEAGELSATQTFKVIQDESGQTKIKLGGDAAEWARFMGNAGKLSANAMTDAFSIMYSDGERMFGGLTAEAQAFQTYMNSMQAPSLTGTLNWNAAPVPDGSHASGLAYVPYDGYIAELHKGERVVPAEDNAGGDASAGILSDILNVQQQTLNTLEEQVRVLEQNNAQQVSAGRR